MFSCEICEICKNTSFTEHLQETASATPQKQLSTLQNLLQNSIRHRNWLSNIEEKVIKDSFAEKNFLTS